MTISLTKYNFTHDLIRESGVFAMHLLGADEDLLERSLAIIMGLGGRSGRDGDKMGAFDTKPGVTGAPILLDAHSYVEGRVVGELVNEENTIFLADVVGAEQLRPGSRLNIGTASRTLLRSEVEAYERNHIHQDERGPPRARACRSWTEDHWSRGDLMRSAGLHDRRLGCLRYR